MKKITAVLLAFIMVLILLPACAHNDVQPAVESEVISAPEPEQSSTPDNSENTTVRVEMPVANHDVTISTWFTWPPPLEGTGFDDPSEFPFWQRFSEATGLDFQFLTVSMFSASEQFQLLLAAEELPQLLTDNSYYAGSLESAINDEIFYNLTDLLEENAPDYLAQVQRMDVMRDVTTANGDFAVFHRLIEETFPPNSGLIIRQDLPEKVGMDSPVTYDDFYRVLSAFKNDLGMEDALFIEAVISTYFSAGYGFESNFIDADGTAVFSADADQFADYVTMMNKWYSEGLITPDFYTYSDHDASADRVEALNSSNTGIFHLWCEDLQRYDFGEDGKVSALPMPVQQVGDEIHLAYSDLAVDDGWAISGNTDLETAILLCRAINYLYTEEGSMMANWGMEGDTYVLGEDGLPYYTDIIMNNPDGLMMNMAIMVYCTFSGAGDCDARKFNLVSIEKYPDMLAVWGTQDGTYKMPDITMPEEDQESFNAIYNDVDTYIDENLVKFIVGDKPLSKMDQFIETLNDIGMQEMIAYKQNALNAYYAR